MCAALMFSSSCGFFQNSFIFLFCIQWVNLSCHTSPAIDTISSVDSSFYKDGMFDNIFVKHFWLQVSVNNSCFFPSRVWKKCKQPHTLIHGHVGDCLQRLTMVPISTLTSGLLHYGQHALLICCWSWCVNYQSVIVVGLLVVVSFAVVLL